MSRVDTMSRFEEPSGSEPESYQCEKCKQIKDAKHFKTDHSPICLECEEEE